MKRYRESQPDGYKTASLLIDKDIFKKLEKAVMETDTNNMSEFIENIVSKHKIKVDYPVRRKKVTTPLIKKNFTFTQSFFDAIKKSGNMTLCVEDILRKELH